MPPYRTNGIYYAERTSLSSAQLQRRTGHVELDESAILDTQKGDSGPLHVVRGLRRSDIAVFLLVTHREEARRAVRSRIGYLVTDVSLNDGSGILVGRQLFETEPEEWVSGHLEGLAPDLIRNGLDFEEQFGLGALQKYFTDRMLPEELPEI